MTVTCESCEYWEAYTETGYASGECRENSPVVRRSDSERWPIVYRDEWCGKHKEKK